MFNDNNSLKEHERFYCTMLQTFYISSKIVSSTRNTYKNFTGNSDRKRPLTGPRPRWVDIIRLDIIGYMFVDRIYLTQDNGKWRVLVNMEMNFRLPYNLGNVSSK